MRNRGCFALLFAACSAPTEATSFDASPRPDASVFALDVHTELDASGALILRVNLPARVDACVEGPCDDVDLDGLTDAWEDAALDRLRPTLRLDEAEPLIDDPAAVVGDIGRVAPTPGEPFGAVVFVVQAYSKDYGSCGVSGHDGDPERVALHVVALDGGGPGDVIVAGAYTAAHEYTATDHGHLFTGADLAQLVHEPLAPAGEPRWVVFPSASKHATYPTVAICEGISPVPCFDEDCDGGADLLPPVLNAGEDAARRVEALDALGFPGEDAWADQDFCGGVDSGTCSAKVRDKLTIDPFGLL